VCHTSGKPSKTDMNTLGTASKTCIGAICGATVDPFCVAKAPSNASITAPTVGTSVALGQSLTFTAAAATNPDGFPLTYKWVFSSGQANATGQSVAVPMSVSGAVTATLQVLNSVGMLATGVVPTRAVTVTAGGNQAPSASIGSPAANTTVAPGGTVNFQGSGIDPNNNVPLTYSWSFTGGSPASSTVQNPGVVTYSTAGTYTASLTVKDSLGLASVAATRTVTVSTAANQKPTATIGSPAANSTISKGGTVNFQGAGTDPDNNVPLTYSWSFPGGSPASSTAQNPGLVTYNTAGTFTPIFTVTDSRGLVSVAVTRTVTVSAAVNQRPTATIGSPAAANTSIVPGGTVNFQGSATDPDSNVPLTYNWSFPGGSPANSTAQNPGLVTYSTAGTFTSSLNVTDSLGLASLAVTRTITVSADSLKPVAVINTPCINVSVMRRGKVSFKGSGTGSTNLPLSFRWDFPGGSPSSSEVQNPGAVSYASVGVFKATLTITDKKGIKSLPASRLITVASPNQALPALGQCSVSNDEDNDNDNDDDDDDENDDKNLNTERSSKNDD
jgi:PKD repeat protein